jgi:hypothetical protein
LKVISPRTAGTGKASQWVPILPQTMKHLQPVFANAPEGAVYILGGLRRRDSMAAADRGDWGAGNLRRRLWHALRASAETNLAARFPLHTVTAWIGHTPQIAERHYLMVRDEEFNRAASENALPKALLALPETVGPDRKPSPGNATNPDNTRVFASKAGRSGTRTPTP